MASPSLAPVDPAIAAIELRACEAWKHLKAIDEAAERFISKPKPYATRTEFDARRGCVLLRAVDVQPVPPELGILVGECVYQLRAMLDNLVYALAERYTGTPLGPRLERNSAFPIRNSGPEYRNAAPRKLGGVDPKVATRIERLQPYHRRKMPQARALWQLEELRNIDQHRLLHPTPMHRASSRYRLSYARGDLLGAGTWQAFNRPLEENALLARFDVVAAVAEPKLYVEEDVTLDIVFDKRSPARSVRQESVVATLSAITSCVRGKVLPALLPYLR